MRVFVFVVLAATAAPALADDADTAALLLADQTTTTAEKSSDWRVFVEGTTREWRQRAGPALHGARLSLDARFDSAFAPAWRAVFADRLDMNRMDGTDGNRDINTLKEAYLSWQPQADRVADLGRINVRNGVAFGYNPTDYFRAGALRSVVSLDPASLRENRLGSAMLRGQTLWDSGSLTAIYSPKLADHPNDASFSPDLGSTNNRDRWQLALSQKFSASLSPQWLLSGGDGQPPQLGLNVTALPNDATVVYFEWAGGRSESLAAQAQIRPSDSAFRSRLSTGLTYTTSNNISLTAEYEYNGAALDSKGWDALRSGPPALYGLYRGTARTLQDPATRQQLFLHALWQDALIKHLDITAMLRYDLADRSRLQWLEARYHWTRIDLALQTQLNNGTTLSDYGAAAERRIWQISMRYFF